LLPALSPSLAGRHQLVFALGKDDPFLDKCCIKLFYHYLSHVSNFRGSLQSESGQFKWDASQRKCYVTCHGKDHKGKGY